MPQQQRLRHPTRPARAVVSTSDTLSVITCSPLAHVVRPSCSLDPILPHFLCSSRRYTYRCSGSIAPCPWRTEAAMITHTLASLPSAALVLVTMATRCSWMSPAWRWRALPADAGERRHPRASGAIYHTLASVLCYHSGIHGRARVGAIQRRGARGAPGSQRLGRSVPRRRGAPRTRTRPPP